MTGIGDKTIERIKDMIREEQNDTYKSEYDENIKLDINNIYRGDCLELMNGIEDKSIDMILCDLPYGTTQNKWDSIIDLNKLWQQYGRIIKNNGAIVLTSAPPFTYELANSNSKFFKYEIIWDKKLSTGFLNAKKQVLRRHENILVFYKEQCTYNPQMTSGIPYDKGISFDKSTNYGKQVPVRALNTSGDRYPTSILEISNANRRNKVHPTEKPVALCEYLIKTYTNEGDLVLDNCIGSGTTAISAINTNRNFIGIELQDEYYKLAKNRVNKYIIDHNLQDKYDILA